MVDAADTLRATHSVLVIDWPSPDVPESLARAGYTVTVKSGPGPRDFSARELRDGEVISRRLDEPPADIDLVYAHRPVEELAGIVAIAKQLGATTLWWQSGLSGPGVRDPTGCWATEAQSRQARQIAETAGLAYVDSVYIADAVRGLRRSASA
jgi:CoA binding domain